MVTSDEIKPSDEIVYIDFCKQPDDTELFDDKGTFNLDLIPLPATPPPAFASPCTRASPPPPFSPPHDTVDSFEVLEQTIIKQKRLAHAKNVDLRMKILLKRTFDLVCTIMDHENGFDSDDDKIDVKINKPSNTTTTTTTSTTSSSRIDSEDDEEDDSSDDDSDDDSDSSSSSSEDESDEDDSDSSSSSSDDESDDDDDKRHVLNDQLIPKKASRASFNESAMCDFSVVTQSRRTDVLCHSDHSTDDQLDLFMLERPSHSYDIVDTSFVGENETHSIRIKLKRNSFEDSTSPSFDQHQHQQASRDELVTFDDDQQLTVMTTATLLDPTSTTYFYNNHQQTHPELKRKFSHDDDDHNHEYYEIKRLKSAI